MQRSVQDDESKTGNVVAGTADHYGGLDRTPSGAAVSKQQRSSALQSSVTTSGMVCALSVVLLIYIVGAVVAPVGAPSPSVFPRVVVELAGVAIGAVLVAASATLMFHLRAAGARPTPPSIAGVLFDGSEPDAVSDPLFKQRLDSVSASMEAVPTLQPEAVVQKTGYGEAALDIAMLFSAGLARPTFDLSAFLNRTVELLAERCAWGEASTALAPDGLSDPFGMGKEQAYVAIFLVDEQGEWATLQAASSLFAKELVLRGHRLHRGDGSSVGWVMMEHRIWRGAGSAGAYHALPELTDMHSAIALPLVPDGSTVSTAGSREMVGVLDIRSARQDAFAQEDVEELTRIASYLSVAISAVRRLREGGVVSGTPSPFHETVNRLAVAVSEAEVYTVMMNALRDFNPARTLIVRAGAPGAHSGSEGEADALHVVIDAPPAVSPRAISSAAPGPLSFSPVVGRAAKSPTLGLGQERGSSLADITPPSLIDIVIMGLALDRPLWVGDLDAYGAGHASQATVGRGLDVESPELASALCELAESSDIGALAFVPLHIAGQAIGGSSTAGGILVIYRTAHRFPPVERYLHDLLADLGGVALERSRLFAAASLQLERERLLSDVRERLRASFDPDVILRTTVQELGRVLGAELTTIELTAKPGDATGVNEVL